MARTIRNTRGNPMARKAALSRNTAIELRGQTKRMAKRSSWTDEALVALEEDFADCPVGNGITWDDVL